MVRKSIFAGEFWPEIAENYVWTQTISLRFLDLTAENGHLSQFLAKDAVKGLFLAILDQDRQN